VPNESIFVNSSLRANFHVILCMSKAYSIGRLYLLLLILSLDGEGMVRNIPYQESVTGIGFGLNHMTTMHLAQNRNWPYETNLGLLS
jgi:hypothetical protein